MIKWEFHIQYKLATDKYLSKQPKPNKEYWDVLDLDLELEVVSSR